LEANAQQQQRQEEQSMTGPGGTNFLNRPGSDLSLRGLKNSKLKDDEDDDDDRLSTASGSSWSSIGSFSSTSGGNGKNKPIIVAVTSCKCSSYNKHKPLSKVIEQLPSKAPSVLKTFHELAIGVIDAYEASGLDYQSSGGVVAEFMTNVNFLLALVNEVAVDALTRGALKEDATFKSIRDVIKKGCKVMENVCLVKRERKYTLYFRIIVDVEVGGSSMEKWLSKLDAWNRNVGIAVELAKQNGTSPGTSTSSSSDTNVTKPPQQQAAFDHSRHSSGSNKGAKLLFSRSSSSSSNTSSNMIARGRSLLPSAGKVKARRATPTPHRRAHHQQQYDGNGNHPNNIANPQAQMQQITTNAAEDGYATSTAPDNNLTHQLQLGATKTNASAMALLDPTSPSTLTSNNSTSSNNAASNNVLAKEELTDMIQKLQMENMPANPLSSSSNGDGTNAIPTNPNFQRIPTSEVPSTVPALPRHYIHRHRILTQVTNFLLERRDSASGPRDLDEEHPLPSFVTSITSRHADKAGNGKSVVMSSVIQSVDVRQRFCDGIIWLDFQNRPLDNVETQIRSLYEELYQQFVRFKRLYDPQNNLQNGHEQQEELHPNDKSSCHFHIGALEGIRHELAHMICRKKILLCLDNVARAEDVDWFLFHNDVQNKGHSSPPNHHDDAEDDGVPFRILLSTRLAQILPNSNEVQVRILSEQEAVKYLLICSGKKPFGNMKQSLLFDEAKMVVKGCGNSPLAVRIEGGILQFAGKNWRRQSPAWSDLLSLGQSNFQEAAELRSFSNSLRNTIEYAFSRIENEGERWITRRCWVAFAYACGDVLCSTTTSTPRGIAKDVILGLFAMMQRQSMEQNKASTVAPTTILATLETLNLLEKSIAKKTNAKSQEKQQQDNNARVLKNSSINNNKSTNHGNSSGNKSVGSSSVSSRSVLKGLVNDNSFDQDGGVAEDGSVVSVVEPTTSLELNFTRVSKSSLPISYSMPTSLIDIALQLPISATTPNENDAGNINKPMSSRKKERKLHGTMVSSLTGGLFAPSSSKGSNVNVRDKSFMMKSIAVNCQRSADIQAYTLEYLPFHMIKSKSYSIAGEMLADRNFISQRFKCFGSIKAVRLQVTDLLHLKREMASMTQYSRSRSYSSASYPTAPTVTPLTSSFDDQTVMSATSSFQSIDVSIFYRDALIKTKEEVYNTEIQRQPPGQSCSTTSLIVARCMSYIGNCFLEGGHPRDALCRLEEATGIYRGAYTSLGSTHQHLIVAKALDASAVAFAKVGEERLALLKYEEALAMYQTQHMMEDTSSTSTSTCSQYYDAIANAQKAAILLSKVGFFDAAGRKYQQCIEIQARIYGAISLPVAKGWSDYGAFLMNKSKTTTKYDDAIEAYAKARAAYKALSSKSNKQQPSTSCTVTYLYQAALMLLSTASIKVKQKDAAAAILSYQKGIDEIRLLPNYGDDANGTAMLKHLVSASMKLGGLKAKRGDDVGALQAYESILEYVCTGQGSICISTTDDNEAAVSATTTTLPCSPHSDLILDAGKAHIKCATIRQTMNQPALAIVHLKEALKHYTIKYGVSHRDTQAIAGSLRQLQLQDIELQEKESVDIVSSEARKSNNGFVA